MTSKINPMILSSHSKCRSCCCFIISISFILMLEDDHSIFAIDCSLLLLVLLLLCRIIIELSAAWWTHLRSCEDTIEIIFPNVLLSFIFHRFCPTNHLFILIFWLFRNFSIIIFSSFPSSNSKSNLIYLQIIRFIVRISL